MPKVKFEITIDIPLTPEYYEGCETDEERAQYDLDMVLNNEIMLEELVNDGNFVGARLISVHPSVRPVIFQDRGEQSEPRITIAEGEIRFKVNGKIPEPVLLSMAEYFLRSNHPQTMRGKIKTTQLPEGHSYRMLLSVGAKGRVMRHVAEFTFDEEGKMLTQYIIDPEMFGAREVDEAPSQAD